MVPYGNFVRDVVRFFTPSNNPNYLNQRLMQQFDGVWFVWLILVCIWNFVWPNVPAYADVLVAIILSILACHVNFL